MRDTQFAPLQAADRYARSHRLSVLALLALAQIEMGEEQATPTSLARGLHISPSQATALLGRLGAFGLVVRSTDPQDLRRVMVSLSKRGREVLDGVFDAMGQPAAELAEKLAAPAIG